jgi:hypothetical protein
VGSNRFFVDCSVSVETFIIIPVLFCFVCYRKHRERGRGARLPDERGFFDDSGQDRGGERAVVGQDRQGGEVRHSPLLRRDQGERRRLE